MSAYEFDGEKYERASSHQKEWGSRLIEELRLSGNETILDLGCGDGVLTERLAALIPNGKVIGLDASRGMIETAKKRERAELEFICMDMSDMDFNGEFDVIYSNAALHWVKNHEKLLAASYRALKPGGMIRWNFGGAGNTPNLTGAIKKFYKGSGWPWFLPAKEEYEKIIAAKGFRDARVEMEHIDKYFGSLDEMAGWIDQPCLVPFEGGGGFRDAVVAEMEERTRQSDGRYLEIFKRIDVKAYK